MFRKRQTNVTVRVELQPYLLEYSNLLERNPSTLLNDVLEGVVRAVEADEPDRAIVTIDLLRRAKGKDQEIKLAEKYHRTLFGTDEPTAEAAVAKQFALDNTSRVTTPLKQAKVAGLPYDGDEGARVRVFGLISSLLTEEVGQLYDSPLMEAAAKEVHDDKVNPQNYFSKMVHTAKLFGEVYDLLLRDHLARAVVREVPKRFLPD